jgi:hypothetical protein
MPDKNRNCVFQLKWNCTERLSLPGAEDNTPFSGKGSIFMKKTVVNFINLHYLARRH